MHRNVAIPDYRSLVTQTSGMDICQIGYDICKFDSLRGLGIVIMGRLHFDNRDRFAIWMGSIGKVTKPCQQTSGCWHRSDFDSFLNLDMGDDTNTKFLLLVYRQRIWLRKWEVIVWDMIYHVGIYGARVAEGLSASNVGLVLLRLHHHSGFMGFIYPYSSGSLHGFGTGAVIELKCQAVLLKSVQFSLKSSQ